MCYNIDCKKQQGKWTMLKFVLLVCNTDLNGTPYT